VIPRVDNQAGPGDCTAVLSQRIRAEYLEMPGLCLTIEQAQRLWSIDRPTCDAAFDTLTATRFLDRTPYGSFVLRATRVCQE